MADTTFSAGTVVASTWLNYLNDLAYGGMTTFKQSGAVGDGVTDDTTAVQAAITANPGKVIDGGGLTYKINLPLTGILSKTVIQNATFDFSSMPAQAGTDKCIALSGTPGGAVSLTANATAGTAIISVGSTSTFTADGYAWLASSTVWDSVTSTNYGLYVRVKSVDSATQLTLYDNLLLDFTTAASASIAPVSMLSEVTFRNIKVLGAQANQQHGIYAEYCEDLTIENCRFLNIDYTAAAMWRCVSSCVTNSVVRFARDSGTAYGFAIWGGCYGCSVVDSWGFDLRHTVTIGDNDGLNLYNRVVNVHAVHSKDAGVESHSASIYTTFIGCHIQMSAAQAGSSNHDGIIIEGANGTVIGCTVVGARGSGLRYNPTFQNGFRNGFHAADNTIDMSAVGLGSSSSQAIYVSLTSSNSADVDAVTLTGNRCSGGASNANGFYHTRIEINKASGIIKKVLIDRLTAVEAAVTNSVLVRTAAASSAVQKVTITGSHLWTSGLRCVYFLADGAGSNIDRPGVYQSTINGGSSFGINFNGTSGTITNAREAWNTWENVTTRRGTANCTGYRFDLSEEAPVSIGGASTYTVSVNDYDIIANRGGTITVTLPVASDCSGRSLRFKTIQAQLVDSASSNVVPIDDSVASTAILPATDGAWAMLKSDGTNWVVMSRG